MARKGILGKKVGMTQVFTDNGELVPVTVVDVTPNVVMQVKTVESDGYEAVQLGYGDMREVLTNKPSVGHAKKADTTLPRVTVIKVTLRRMANPAVLWRTVLVTIVVQVHLGPSLTRSSRARNYLVGWVTTPAPCKTCKSLPLTQSTMFC